MAESARLFAETGLATTIRGLSEWPSAVYGYGLMGLPVGTITFLFTDIEGSTRLWEA